MIKASKEGPALLLPVYAALHATRLRLLLQLFLGHLSVVVQNSSATGIAFYVALTDHFVTDPRGAAQVGFH